MNFCPFNDIETISARPMLFIGGDQAHSREASEEAYMRGAESSAKPSMTSEVGAGRDRHDDCVRPVCICRTVLFDGNRDA